MELEFNNRQAGYKFPTPQSGLFKVALTGELSAVGKESLLEMAINNESSQHVSFLYTDGQNNAGNVEFLPEPHARAIYLGHNQVHEDCDFLVDLTIGVYAKNQSIVVNGTSTFALSGGHVAGYRIHGRLATNDRLSDLQFRFSEGNARGFGRITLL